MTRTQKGLLIGFLFLCLCLVAGAAVGMFLFVRKVTETPVSPNDPVVPAREAEKARREAVQHAKVSLPPESGIPPGWDFAKALETWNKEVDYVTGRVVWDILSGQREVSRARLAEFLRLTATDDAPVQITPDNDPRSRTAQQILEVAGDRLMGSEILAIFERAMRHQLCYVPYEVEREYWDQPHAFYRGRDTLMHHLVARGKVYASRGDAARALQTYFSLLDFAAQVATEPFVDNQSNRLKIEANADEILWVLLDRCPIEQIDSAAVQARVETRKDTTQLARVIGEDARLFKTRQMHDAEFEEPGGLFLRFLVSLADPTDYDEVEKSAQNIIALLGRPYHEVAEQLDEIVHGDQSDWYESDFAGACADAFRDHARNALFADVFPVALALKRYRAAIGAYPEALDVLVPDYIASIPNDPTVGTPVLYVTCGEGFLIVAPPDYEYYGGDEFDAYHAYNDSTEAEFGEDWEDYGYSQYFETREILWSAEN